MKASIFTRAVVLTVATTSLTASAGGWGFGEWLSKQKDSLQG